MANHPFFCWVRFGRFIPQMMENPTVHRKDSEIIKSAEGSFEGPVVTGGYRFGGAPNMIGFLSKNKGSKYEAHPPFPK